MTVRRLPPEIVKVILQIAYSEDGVKRRVLLRRALLVSRQFNQIATSLLVETVDVRNEKRGALLGQLLDKRPELQLCVHSLSVSGSTYGRPIAETVSGTTLCKLLGSVPNLRELALLHYAFVVDPGWQTPHLGLLSTFHHLTRLTIEGPTNLFEQLASKLPNLEDLSLLFVVYPLEQCPNQLAPIVPTFKLKTLTIHDTSTICYRRYWKFVIESSRDSINYLNLTYQISEYGEYESVDVDELGDLLQSCPNLTKLKITAPEKDLDLGFLGNLPEHLTVLDLSAMAMRLPDFLVHLSASSFGVGVHASELILLESCIMANELRRPWDWEGTDMLSFFILTYSMVLLSWCLRRL